MHAFLALSLVAAVPAAPGWFVVEEPAFSVQLPRKPHIQRSPDDGNTVDYQLALKLEDGQVLEMGLSVSTPPEDVRRTLQAVTAAQLKGVQDGMLGPGGFKMTSEAEAVVAVGAHRYPARDFTGVNADGRKISARIVSAEGRLFQRVTLHPAARPLDAEHARFVASLRIAPEK
jgi:hypothetical protein